MSVATIKRYICILMLAMCRDKTWESLLSPKEGRMMLYHDPAFSPHFEDMASMSGN